MFREREKEMFTKIYTFWRRSRKRRTDRSWHVCKNFYIHGSFITWRGVVEELAQVLDGIDWQHYNTWRYPLLYMVFSDIRLPRNTTRENQDDIYWIYEETRGDFTRPTKKKMKNLL